LLYVGEEENEEDGKSKLESKIMSMGGTVITSRITHLPEVSLL
jgi:hypothetical protein